MIFISSRNALAHGDQGASGGYSDGIMNFVRRKKKLVKEKTEVSNFLHQSLEKFGLSFRRARVNTSREKHDSVSFSRTRQPLVDVCV